MQIAISPTFRPVLGSFRKHKTLPFTMTHKLPDAGLLSGHVVNKKTRKLKQMPPLFLSVIILYL